MKIEEINKALDFLTSQLEKMLNVPKAPSNDINQPNQI